MACSLRTIERACGRNLAGIRSLKLILPADVASAPDAVSVPNLEGNITFQSGKSAYTIELDPGSGAFSESLASTEQGDYYQQAVSFSIRKDRVEVSDLVRLLRNTRVSLLFTDANGYTRYIEQMRLRDNDVVNGPRGRRNGTDFTFRGQSANKAPFLNGSLVDPTPGSGDIVALQDPLGNVWELRVDDCGAIVTRLISYEDPNVEISVDNWIITSDEDGALNTNNP